MRRCLDLQRRDTLVQYLRGWVRNLAASATASGTAEVGRMGRGEIAQRPAPVESLLLLPDFQPIDHVVGRAQQCDRIGIVALCRVAGLSTPEIDPLMCKFDQVIAHAINPQPVRHRCVAIGLLDPLRHVAVRQVMYANTLIRRHVIAARGMEDISTVDSGNKIHGATSEQTWLEFGPVIGPLIMNTQDVMALGNPVYLGARCQQLLLDEGHRLLAQAFVVIQGEYPVMRALGQGKGARILHCG